MQVILKVALISLLIVAVLAYTGYPETALEESRDTKVYQGPVPLGYDQDHFRKTGETIPLNGRS